MKYRTSSVFNYVVVLSGVITVIGAFSCPPISACNQTQCAQQLLCPGSKVKDVCGCCDECARQRYQTCGGSLGLDGKCDKGLKCVPQGKPDTPQNLLGTSGICIESHSSQLTYGGKKLDELCISVVCDETLTCPEGSLLVSADAQCCPSSQSKDGSLSGGLMCKCDPSKCLFYSPICDEVRERRVLVRSGTGIPGDCCNIYQCSSLETNCSLVKCPKDPTCPEDSYPLPNSLTVGECCAKPGGCMCLPKECENPKCLPGQRLKVLREGTEKAGRCCPIYHCINEGEQTCFYNGLDYLDGEEWKADKCTSCTCKGNVTFCNAIECNSTELSCGQMKVPPGECCAVCIGCISATGSPYENGEEWREGDCNVCTCVNGRVECQAEFCAPTCTNSKKIPGQCCPHCDEPTVLTLPSRCSSLSNCTLLCANGFVVDSLGCYTCQCKLDGCNLTCEHGYAVDEFNRSICKCKCPALVGCDKKCIHGLKSDSIGCTVCKCFSCRSLKCAQKCPYGYVRNARGCRTCKCMSEPNKDLQTTTENSRVPTHKQLHCHLKDGLREEDETWHDGCRTCYCHYGKEFCALINCPDTDCEDSVLFPNECCPKCLKTAIVPKSVNTVVCPSTNGGFYLEGEMWMLDSCTPCVCHGGQMFCGSYECSPHPCEHPVYSNEPGRCCPECHELKKTINPTNRSCSTKTGKVYEDGAEWWAGDCQSCKCSNGKIACFLAKCPKVSCDTPVLKKGQCCSFCVDMTRPSCLHDDILHDTGEIWMLNECTQCMCLNGLTTCKERICDKQCNESSMKVPGLCCPICHGGVNQSVLSTRVPISFPNGSGISVTTPKDVNAFIADESWWTSVAIYFVISIAVLVFICAVIFMIWCLRRKFKKGNWEKKKSYSPLNTTTNKLPVSEITNTDLNNKTVHIVLYEANDKLLNNKPIVA